MMNVYLPKLKNVYSTLNSFNSLNITAFSPGSVIINFQISLNSIVLSEALANLTAILQKNLAAVLTLVTTGLVQIKAPPGPVPYNSTQNLSCTALENTTTSKWILTNTGNFDITTGTEANVSSTGGSITVELMKTSELWAGTYTCVFSSATFNVTIENKASAKLDVALMPPSIDISISPQFPDCRSKSSPAGVVSVLIECVIMNSTEMYSVAWTQNNTGQLLDQHPYSTGNKTTYSVWTSISCTETSQLPAVTCTFTNRLNQPKSVNVEFPVIYENTIVCFGENVWPTARVNYTAKLACSTGVGYRTRACNSHQWEEEISNCVNPDLNDLLSDSLIFGSGRGTLANNAENVFVRLVSSTSNSMVINTYANLNAAVTVLSNMNNISTQVNYTMNVTQLLLALNSSSNILNDTLTVAWNSSNSLTRMNNMSMAERYLLSVEGLVEKSEVNGSTQTYPNIELQSCQSNGSLCKNSVFNVNVSMSPQTNIWVKTVGFKSLNSYLPKKIPPGDLEINSIVVSTTVENRSIAFNGSVTINFQLTTGRKRNHEMVCVYWDLNISDWSSEGCTWGGATLENLCTCNHLSAFSILVSKKEVSLLFVNEITYTGLGLSIISLVICLLIESLMWGSLVKSSIAYCSHTAQLNICLCLLIADCCFLASSSNQWCQISVVLMHFCYLAMFFWMLCLSIIILHKMIFIFHQISKKVYLGLSFFIGYICPLIIVFITFVTFDYGKKNSYYDPDTCWLMYSGLFKGSIFAFLLPVWTIVIINVFCMVVVIMRLLKPSVEIHNSDKKEDAKKILKIVIHLTPIFGATWIMGFFVLMVDLTDRPLADAVNYIFILLNAFQGFFILLTAYLGEKTVRVALLKYINIKRSISALGESSTKLSSSLKK
ncbi:hypothetical protein DPEC_G00290600 [Dallia pectoralis]|uniref:Uncharacterized protein n=1 Tax=Dallia pectoralis TaxID=75939 RepID=A0ACC2FHI1_DALPE|nr:hypothetical protein DPEC_G00290600 [Dallia pectoralis]